jgi:hypothetical protein
MTVQLGSGRAMTIIAVGFLELDGVLLGLAGLWHHEWSLLIPGFGLAMAGGIVLLYWRRHRRRLEEIAAARQEMRGEVQALREMIKQQD